MLPFQMNGSASSVQTGDALEAFVFNYISAEIAGGRFLFTPDSATVTRKKPYFSKDRQANIVFDIAVESRLPGAEAPSVIVLIECKNYGHPVPVDDIEEFFAKIQQVAAANGKGVMFCSNSFQRGTLEYAKSKGIALVRVFPDGELKYELRRTVFVPDGDAKAHTEQRLRDGMSTEQYRSRRSAFYAYSGGRFHSSVNRTIGALLSQNELRELAPIRRAATPPEPVPFVSTETIGSRCDELLESVDYTHGPVKLADICNGLGVRLTESNRRMGIDGDRSILGRINFETAEILLYPDPSEGRRRFTLAHEIGHFALGHGKYFVTEAVDETDLQLSADEDRDSETIRRLEWQANCFAARILLPTKAVLAQLSRLALKHDLRDKGHGLIYVDYQPTNQATYHAVIGALGMYFQATKSAVAFRLAGLGLLNDQRGMKPFRFGE